MSKSVAVEERLFTSRTEELLSSSSKKPASRNRMSVSSANFTTVSSASFATANNTFGNNAQRLDDFEDESLESVISLFDCISLLLQSIEIQCEHGGFALPFVEIVTRVL